MARIKFGMMMTDARGKLGGQVFSKNRSGAIVRTKVTPTNPQTVAQATARAALGSASSTWATLTEAQRAAWNAAAAEVVLTNIFGDTYHPSGKNYFVGVQSNLSHVGKSATVTPTAGSSMQFLGFEPLSFDLTAQEFDVIPNADLSDPQTNIVLQVTPPLSAGIYNFTGKYRTVLTWLGSAQPGPSDFYNAYVEKFGLPLVGQKIGIRAYAIDSSGHSSNAAQAETVVIASP